MPYTWLVLTLPEANSITMKGVLQEDNPRKYLTNNNVSSKFIYQQIWWVIYAKRDSIREIYGQNWWDITWTFQEIQEIFAVTSVLITTWSQQTFTKNPSHHWQQWFFFELPRKYITQQFSLQNSTLSDCNGIRTHNHLVCEQTLQISRLFRAKVSLDVQVTIKCKFTLKNGYVTW